MLILRTRERFLTPYKKKFLLRVFFWKSLDTGKMQEIQKFAESMAKDSFFLPIAFVPRIDKFYKGDSTGSVRDSLLENRL